MIRMVVKVCCNYIIRAVFADNALHIANQILGCIFGVSTEFLKMIIAKSRSRISVIEPGGV